MFRIGEFSKLTQVSIRMLRYYDEIGLLKPSQIDRFTGYRLYSVEQIQILQRIILLRDTGFNTSEIAVVLKNWDSAFITDQLKKKKHEILQAIELEKEKLRKIDNAINDIQEEKISVHYNVSIKSIPAYQVFSLRKIIPDYFCEEMLWREMSDYIKSEHINISEKNSDFAIYHDTEYKDADVDVEVCTIVNAIGESRNGFTFRETERVDSMACIMVYGSYENIAVAYESFAHWLIKHDQYEMAGQNRQICHIGPWNDIDPSKYLTEIQIPIAVKK